MIEGAGFVPVSTTDVATLWGATAVDDDAEDDEADDGDDLDDGEDEFGFAVSAYAEEVDGDDEDKIDGHPSGVGDVSMCPVVDRDGCGDDLEG